MKLPENIAYSKKYQKMREDAMPILDDKFFEDEQAFELSDNYTAIFRNYDKTENGYRLSGSRFFLKKNSNIIFTYDMPLDYGALITKDILYHNNGNRYILLRAELYGYSVLNIDILEIQHYIPKDRENGKESFIWCDVKYCPKNNFLCVEGCYWACPNGAIIVDFSNPEQMPTYMYDFQFADDDEDIDTIKNTQWNDNSSLAYQAEICEEDGSIKTENRILSTEKIKKWLYHR